MEIEPNEPNGEESGDTIDPDYVRNAFKSAEKKAAEAQDLANQAAQYAGYTREVIRVTTPFFIQLAELAQDNPLYHPIVASGVQFVNSLHHELDQSFIFADLLVQGL